MLAAIQIDIIMLAALTKQIYVNKQIGNGLWIS